ncbi:MAG: response regulator transcription factor [Cypionkella sp.]
MRILAVDDEPYILELIPLLAAKSGFSDVTTASSGPRALEALVGAEVAFECLLLDINMPGMDGIDLCRRVRQLEAYHKTPIIMLTAMSEGEYMDSAFKAGATDYATKPFDIKELGARLRVAKELVEAWGAAQAVKASQANSGTAIHRKHGFDLSEAIRVEGVKDLVDFASLQNYLKQSSRAGIAASQVVAVKIDQIEDIYARATAAEFTYAVREVADAVNEVVRTRGDLISYAGGGIFVIISNSAAQLSSSELEAEVQNLLDEKNSEYDSGAPLDIEVSIGNPIKPNFSDVADASMSLDRAIARAEHRSKTKHDSPPPVNIRRGQL